MKAKIVLLGIMAAAGVLASVAVAKPPHGDGHSASSTTTAASTAATTTAAAGKVLVCHKVGNGRWVLLRVSVHSAHARGAHGDVPAVGGACPGPTQGHHGGAATTSTATTVTATS